MEGKRRPDRRRLGRPTAAGGVASLCAACTIVAAGCGHGGVALLPRTAATAQARSPQAACRDAVVSAIAMVARRIYSEAQSGPNAVGYSDMIAGSRSLAAAVTRGDAAAARAALLPLLARQLVHVRVTRGQTLLADLGKPDALAPRSGVVRDTTGAAIAAFTIAVQDDRAYIQVLHGITGADVLLRSGSRQVLGTLTPGPAAVPGRGQIRYRDTVYEAQSFAGSAYPAGPLRISVLVPSAQIGSCPDGADVAALDTLGSVGRRIYAGEASSGKVASTIRRMQKSARFRSAVARSDRTATLAAINGFFRLHQFHIVRARVIKGGRVLADLGGPAVLGPAQGVLRDRGGRRIGRFLVAVQDDTGYIKLVQRFVGADVVMRSAGRLVATSLSTPPQGPLPRRGTVHAGGRSYRVFSFTATSFPAGTLDISLLFGAA